jgi:hypothetical protein
VTDSDKYYVVPLPEKQLKRKTGTVAR